MNKVPNFKESFGNTNLENLNIHHEGDQEKFGDKLLPSNFDSRSSTEDNLCHSITSKDHKIVQSDKFPTKNQNSDNHILNYLNLEINDKKVQTEDVFISNKHLTWIIESFYSISICNLIQKVKKIIKKQTISDIISKVTDWKKLSNDYRSTLNINMFQSKIKAAKEMNEQKKTLDDFLTILRLGIVYNFNFADHLDDKFIVLRKFIKAKAGENKWKAKLNEDIESLQSLIVINQ